MYTLGEKVMMVNSDMEAASEYLGLKFVVLCDMKFRFVSTLFSF